MATCFGVIIYAIILIYKYAETCSHVIFNLYVKNKRLAVYD
jgi:hypothetical protein